MADTLQVIVSVVGVGVVILLALTSVAWRLGRRLERVENRIDDMGAGIRSLNQQMASIVGLIPTVFMFLHRSKAITDQEYYETIGQFTSQVARGTESLVEHVSRSMNPLSQDEGQRFGELVGKARRGEFFTRPKVEEYDVLIRKVQAERPNDPRIWPLVALGAFLSGLYVGQRRADA